MFYRLLVLFVALWNCSGASEEPIEHFFKNPEYALVTLSPNGKRVAYLAPWKKRMNIFTQNLKTHEVTQLTHTQERDIRKYSWCNDDMLVYEQDQNGDENFHIYSVDRRGKQIKDLTPFPGVACSTLLSFDRIDRTILIQTNQRNPQLFDVYRVDIYDGTMSLVAENPGNVAAWLPDRSNQLRLALTNEGLEHTLFVRTNETETWRPILHYTFTNNIVPLSFTPDGKSLYALSNLGRDKLAAVIIDLENGQESTCLFEHPDVDLEQILYSDYRETVTGVGFMTNRTHYQWFTPEAREWGEFLEQRFPDCECHLISHDRKEMRMILHVSNDRDPGHFYLFFPQKKILLPLFDGAPWIDPTKMSETKPISYAARDGLPIHGYLTLPAHFNTSSPLPLVINPHGGPWARDQWRFNSEVQFLASRGYAVLQINFRGSTGYGRSFWMKGFKEWGRKMQDDITDGVVWSIQEGIADPKRIAIYGGSYGGYAALMGITKTPDLYAAAIDYVGVSNLFTFTQTIPPYWECIRQQFGAMIGDLEQDREQLIEASPALHVDRIKTPLLIAQGAHDPRVNRAESDQMVAALQARGIEVQYLLKENEGHGFRNEENKLDFYRAMIQFLDHNLKKKD